MQIILCPGIHPPELTLRFWDAIQHQECFQAISDRQLSPLIFPEAQSWAFSAIHINHWLTHIILPGEPSVMVAFSAGVVGAIGAAWMQQCQDVSIKALIAIDGWGVPLHGSFPIYRFSHDRFTHNTSHWIGGDPTFYAEPAVDHLQMWRSPQQVKGWWYANDRRQQATLAEVMVQLLLRYLT